MYGDPVKNAQYWQAQSYENCVLMATTMVIGQLTGTMPAEEEIHDYGDGTTEAVVDLGQRCGPWAPRQRRREGCCRYCWTERRHHVPPSRRMTRPKAPGAGCRDDGAGLTIRPCGRRSQPTIWNAVENKPLPEGVITADHQVVILGVDRTKGIVYINDSGFAEEGKNMKVPLDVFMKAWQADDYETMVAERKAQDPSASAVDRPAFPVRPPRSVA